MLQAFCARVASGDSWLVMIVMLAIAGIICLAMSMKHNILGEWAFEPIIEVPKAARDHPFVKTWFALTRGFQYSTKPEKGVGMLDMMRQIMKEPTKPAPVANEVLFSGFAFSHFLQHFCMAFACPKLAWVSFVFGIGWEIVEAKGNAHCALDIFWNTCGCLFGLLVRLLVLPDTFRSLVS